MRLLVVEDELRMAEQLRRGLSREGYSVTIAHDGETAFELIRTMEHDILVLDWMVPQMDGRELARRTRLAGIKTPILMLTARDAVPDVVEGLDGGADDYLTKPFAFEVLLARLRALARRGPTAHGPTLEVKDLALDPATHRTSRAGQEIRLSQREFKLLHFLMRRADHVVDRNVLIEAVWGYGCNIESNTLDAYIHLLRGKIDAGHDTKLIHTVRGVGYCVSEHPR